MAQRQPRPRPLLVHDFGEQRLLLGGSTRALQRHCELGAMLQQPLNYGSIIGVDEEAAQLLAQERLGR